MRYLFIFLINTALFAQSTLTVQVAERYTAKPIPAVSVKLQQGGSTVTAFTDSTGTAKLTFTPPTDIKPAPVYAERPQKIELYNILGQKLFTVKNYETVKVKMVRLASGVYILRAVYRDRRIEQAKSVVFNGRAVNAGWNGILHRRTESQPNRSLSLSKVTTTGELHLSLSKEGFTSFDTTFAAPAQDTTLNIFLHKYNLLKIKSFDAQGNELSLPFAVNGLSNNFSETGDSLILFSGRYRLQSQNPDTLQTLIDTVEIVSDTLLNYQLKTVQKYNLKIKSYDTQGNELYLPFAVDGLNNNFSETGDSLILFSGRYRLQSQNPDTLETVIDTIRIVSDTTIVYNFEKIQKHRIELSFYDLVDNNPIIDLDVELWKDGELKYKYKTDSSGVVSDSVFSSIYNLKANRSGVKSLEEELDITNDHIESFETDEKDSVIIQLKYPNGDAANDINVKIGTETGKTDMSGKFATVLWDDDYTLSVSGNQIDDYSKDITVSSRTTIDDIVTETITFSDPNILFDESDSLFVNPSDYVDSPEGITESSFESLDSLLIINENIFKGLHKNTAGTFNYILDAIAKHGTHKSASFTAVINQMKLFEGHIYELLEIYDNKDTVSFKGKIEVSYRGDPYTYYIFNTDENGHFNFTIPLDKEIAYLKYYTIDDNDEINSFVVTYDPAYKGPSEINKQEDWLNIGLMVIRFNGLIHDYNVPEEWAVKKITFKEFFHKVNSGNQGLIAINYENNQYPYNPERDPDAKGCYRIIIPLDQAAKSGLFPNALEIDSEEQEEIYQAYLDSVDTKIPDPKMRPEIVKLAPNDTLPIWYTANNNYFRPEFRNFIYIKRSNYGFSFLDMGKDGESDGDGIIDGGYIYAYEPRTISFFVELYSGVLSAPNAVYYDNFSDPDDIKGKTNYLEQYLSLWFSHYVDKKYTFDIIYNISTSFTTEFEHNGIKFTKFNYYPYMPEDYILGIRR